MTPTAHVWNNSLSKANTWLAQLGVELGSENPHLNLFVLRSVLHTLRDCLPADGAVHLAAQMPLIIKGLYFDGWHPGVAPIKARTKEEFLALVKQRMHRAIPAPDTEHLTRAVFKLMAARISEGDISDVRRILPAGIAELWPIPTAASSGGELR